MALVSASKLIALIGGNGFLGRHVIERMHACNYPIRVLTRGGGDWQNSNVSSLRQRGIDVVIGDLTDDDTVEKVVDGAACILNMSGILQESKSASFEDVHVKAVEKLTAKAAEAKVQRFVHISCLGCRPDSECSYYKTKWQGEELVRKGSFLWTILRPSFMFGDDFPLLAYLKPIWSFKLFMPLIGSGTNVIQPIFVEDVADCVVQAIYERATVRNSYDLVGPDEYTMVELLEMVRHAAGLGGSTVNISTQFSGKAFDMFARAVPRSMLNDDLIGLMSENSAGSQDDMLEAFQVRCVPLKKMLPPIIDSLMR